MTSYKFTGTYQEKDTNRTITIPFIAFNPIDRMAQGLIKTPAGFRLTRIEQFNKFGSKIYSQIFRYLK